MLAQMDCRDRSNIATVEAALWHVVKRLFRSFSKIMDSFFVGRAPGNEALDPLKRSDQEVPEWSTK